LNRTEAASGLPITLRTAQDFVSHYPLNPKQTTQLFREFALDLNRSF